jgi:hypothetical protein
MRCHLASGAVQEKKRKGYAGMLVTLAVLTQVLVYCVHTQRKDTVITVIV